jgi:hypothetical protein
MAFSAFLNELISKEESQSKDTPPMIPNNEEYPTNTSISFVIVSIKLYVSEVGGRNSNIISWNICIIPCSPKNILISTTKIKNNGNKYRRILNAIPDANINV